MNMKSARIYLRVSSEEQDLARQERLIDEARSAGYYIAGVYREKASGACTAMILSIIISDCSFNFFNLFLSLG